jgi:predicted TIM-barrel fold metal-dependent hydrolase
MSIWFESCQELFARKPIIQERCKMIIDSHAHIFPYLGSGKEAGFRSVEEHLLYSQRMIADHIYQPVRRKEDNSVVSEETLWDPEDRSERGKYEVDFRAGEYGRYEWTKDGVDYYLQYMPPSLQNMAAPPGLLKAMMDYAGVDKAVLQCGKIYGKLNEYYSHAMKQYPHSFIPLANIEEERAYEEDQIEDLRQAISHLGLKGLWFYASEDSFEKTYDVFWSEVVQMQIPAFIFLFPVEGIFFQLLKKLGEWKERFESLQCVIPQAFPVYLIRSGKGIEVPAEATRIIKEHRILIELVYPISQGREEEYPYPLAQEAVRVLYDALGPKKLVWGTDVPNVERYCTYNQSLNYLKDYCSFIPPKDMDLILGGNLANIFKI